MFGTRTRSLYRKWYIWGHRSYVRILLGESLRSGRAMAGSYPIARGKPASSMVNRPAGAADTRGTMLAIIDHVA